MKPSSEPPRPLPVGLLLTGRPCLVVGGGPVATRKVHHLLGAGAQVTVVAPELTTELAGMRDHARIEYHPRPFTTRDLDGCFLVIAATGTSAVNGRVQRLCQGRGILCNIADAQWAGGDFVTSGVIERPGFTIALNSLDGDRHRLRRLREWLDRHLPADL